MEPTSGDLSGWLSIDSHYTSCGSDRPVVQLLLANWCLNHEIMGSNPGLGIENFMALYVVIPNHMCKDTHYLYDSI